MSWAGQVALVTGGASGIGRALCEHLAAAGARVLISDRDLAGAQALAERLGARALALDVSDAPAFSALVEQLWEEEGGIDLLINNAGVGLAGELRDTDLAAWERVLAVNLRGVIHGVHALYPRMVARGRGQILNVASGAGLLPRPGMSAYAATKHAVVGLSTSLRAEAASLGVKVNVACPGFVGTQILSSTHYAGLDGDALQAQVAKLPVGAQSPEQCAARILRGAARNRGVILTDLMVRLEWLCYRWFPWLGASLARLRGRRLRALRTSPAPSLPAPEPLHA